MSYVIVRFSRRPTRVESSGAFERRREELRHELFKSRGVLLELEQSGRLLASDAARGPGVEAANPS